MKKPNLEQQISEIRDVLSRALRVGSEENQIMIKLMGVIEELIQRVDKIEEKLNNRES